jgi:hypothetical protein
MARRAGFPPHIYGIIGMSKWWTGRQFQCPIRQRIKNDTLNPVDRKKDVDSL